jgi:hypothetical protein
MIKRALLTLITGVIIYGAAYQAPIEANFAEYTEEDPDFAEVNYSECNRLGDTDFYGIVRADGSVLILEEDMKWTIDKGADLEKITERLEGFEDKIIRLRDKGQDRYTNVMWVKWATDAIEGNL